MQENQNMNDIIISQAGLYGCRNFFPDFYHFFALVFAHPVCRVQKYGLPISVAGYYLYYSLAYIIPQIATPSRMYNYNSSKGQV